MSKLYLHLIFYCSPWEKKLATHQHGQLAWDSDPAGSNEFTHIYIYIYVYCNRNSNCQRPTLTEGSKAPGEKEIVISIFATPIVLSA